MAIQRAIDIAGGLSGLARAIGVAPATIGNWRMRGCVPDAWCATIETATSGAVTCEELRPDLPWVRVEGRPMLDAVALAQRKLRPDSYGGRHAA
jgi:DNA-binding transcriptional regulator YdaS (Cro superfamily)